MSRRIWIAAAGIVFFFERANAQPALIEEFGAQSSVFIGTCLGTEFLKKNFCSSTIALDHKNCISEALAMLPLRMRADFEYAINQNYSLMHKTTSNAVERGYKSVLATFGQNGSEACIAYSASMHTAAEMKKLEIKKIASQIR